MQATMDIQGKLTKTLVLPFNSFSSHIMIIIYEHGKENVFRVNMVGFVMYGK
jgi:hypothetical protein